MKYRIFHAPHNAQRTQQAGCAASLTGRRPAEAARSQTQRFRACRRNGYPRALKKERKTRANELRPVPTTNGKRVATEFALISWNLNKKCARPRWPEYFNQLHRYYPAEFILFQELNYRLYSVARTFSPHQDQGLYHDNGYHFTFLPNLRQLRIGSYRKAYAGVATLSPLDCTEHLGYISRAREPLAFTPKPMLASSYELTNGQSLLLINIHAINFVHTRHFEDQLAQLHEVLLRHRRRHKNAPAIIAGDFNSWHSSRIRAIGRMLQRCSSHFREVDFGDQNQHIKRAPKVFQQIFGMHHLDRIYYDAESLSLCEQPQVLYRAGETALDISDHAPLYVRFRC